MFIFLIGLLTGIGLIVLASMVKKKEVVISKSIKKSKMFMSKSDRIIKPHKKDINRIRELNNLSRNEETFYRLLNRSTDLEIIVSNRRFITCNSKNQPIAIFVYQDGNPKEKSKYSEEGIPKIIYRGMPTEEEIRNDFCAALTIV